MIYHRLGWWTAVAALAATALFGLSLTLLVAPLLGATLANDAQLREAWIKFTGVLPGAAFMLGGGHFAARHPYFDDIYHGWLTMSPWRPGKPLPQGETAPTWDHALFLALAGAITYLTLPEAEVTLGTLCLCVACYGIGRAIMQAWTYLELGLPEIGLLTLAMLIGAFYGVFWGPAFSLAVVLALQPVLFAADRTLWRRFPWRDNAELHPRVMAEANLLGMWPYSATAPRLPAASMPWRRRAGWVALCTWLAFTLAAIHLEPVCLLAVGGGALMCLQRMLWHAKRWHERPPTRSWLWEPRLFLRHLSGYHGWILAALLLQVVATAGKLIPLPAVLLCPLLTLAALVPLALAGPDTEVWRLVAPADLAGNRDPRQFEEL